jgi:hypothetical protein
MPPGLSCWTCVTTRSEQPSGDAADVTTTSAPDGLDRLTTRSGRCGKQLPPPRRGARQWTRGNLLGRSGARGLASCPRLEGLRELDLTSNELNDSSIEALASSPFLTGLRRLALGINLIDDEGARIIARSPHWTALEELNLSANQIGDEGVTALLASPVGQNVESLFLGGNRHGTRAQSAVQWRRVEKRPQQERCSRKETLRDR